MIKRTLYFGNPAYLSTSNEQLVLKFPVVEKNGELPESFKRKAAATIPIEDIGMVIIDNQQITVTHDLCEKLLANNAIMLWCDTHHLPVGITLPMAANDTLAEKTRYQLEATESLKKQLWKQTIEAKVANQAIVLKVLGLRYIDLEHLSKQVQSGDAANVEARAAALYWERLLQPFKTTRGRSETFPNNFLNYAYAILRAIIARNLVASGLLPILGIHHRNKYNHYCLADDIMEPYRPLVDLHIFNYLSRREIKDIQLTNEDKKEILWLAEIDVLIDKKTSPLMVASQRTTSSLMRCFSGELRKIQYPTPSI